MKIYKTVEQIKADIVDSKLVIKGDVRFDVSFSIDASIVVDAGNIDAWDIKAKNIKAGDIDALDIKAKNIKAGDISFYAFAVAYVSFKCKSILGRRENSKYFCLDNEVEITGETLKASE